MKYFISYTIELPLREKYLYSEFFWSVLSRIRTECGKIRTRKIPRTIFTQCLLLVKKRSEQGTRNHQQIIFRKVWTIHTQNSDQRSIFEYYDEIEVKLPFLLIFLNILEYIWWPLQSRFLFMGKKWLKFRIYPFPKQIWKQY